MKAHQRFRDLVRAFRRRLGVTQQELADKSGLGVRSIRKIEAGDVKAPRPATVRLLANAFELSGTDRDQFFEAAAQAETDQQTPGLAQLRSAAPRPIGEHSSSSRDLPVIDKMASVERHGITSGGGTRPPIRDAVSQTADQLAGVLADRLRREEELHQISGPLTLAVAWRNADEDLVRTVQMAEPIDLSGQLSQIVEAYQRVPSGRLVILGPGGSGKTVLATQLALGLLAQRESDDPVPVIASIGSWDPTVPLLDWLADILIRDHPGLGSGDKGRALLRELASRRQILPILDGFDEIGSGLHAAAIGLLNTMATLPMVLTSRPTEYRLAVEQVDVLTNAVGIELNPLTIKDLSGYLPRGTWDRIISVLDQPGGLSATALGRALSTPLMVCLAHTIYSDAATDDVTELLDTDRFPTAESIEEHLLASYLPAAYRRLPPSGRRWDLWRVRRWLSHLATHLTTRQTPDLSWGQLRAVVPRAARVLSLGVVCGLGFGLMYAAVFGLKAGPSVHILDVTIATTILGITVLGFAFGVVAAIEGPPVPTPTSLQKPGPARALKLAIENVRWTTPFGALVGGIFGGFTGGPYGAFIGGLLLLLLAAMFGVFVGAETPVDLRAEVGFSTSLKADRRSFLRKSVALATFCGAVYCAAVLASGSEFEFRWIAAGFGNFFLLGILINLPSAWGQGLFLVRVWLPLTNRLPWRLHAFLDHAHRIGVLRQNGAAYQFRHQLLQAYLTPGKTQGEAHGKNDVRFEVQPSLPQTTEAKRPRAFRASPIASVVLLILLSVTSAVQIGQPNESAQPAPSPTPASTPTAPLPSASATPSGEITAEQLLAAGLILPQWADLCSGKVSFPKVVYTNLDNDSDRETAAIATCRQAKQLVTTQIVAFDREADGRIVQGQVVRLAAPARFTDLAPRISGGVIATVVSDDGTDAVSQQREYAWDGMRFVQTAGPTEFPPVVRGDLMLTVTDRTPVVGSTSDDCFEKRRDGSFAITVKNISNAVSARFYVVYDDSVGAGPSAYSSNASGWVRTIRETRYIEWHAPLKPGQSATFTLTTTMHACPFGWSHKFTIQGEESDTWPANDVVYAQVVQTTPSPSPVPTRTS